MVLELVHVNIYGLFNEMAWGGFHYFITFTDDFSRIFFCVHDEVYVWIPWKFKEYKVEVEKQIDSHVKALQSDCHDEYMSIEFEKLLKENGIIS